MITEEEAKEKWCPFIRWVVNEENHLAFNNRIDQAEISLNEDQQGGAHSLCVASECMAWRWDKNYELDTGDKKPSGKGWKKRSIVGRMVWSRSFTGKDREGRCGLAGE